MCQATNDNIKNQSKDTKTKKKTQNTLQILADCSICQQKQIDRGEN